MAVTVRMKQIFAVVVTDLVTREPLPIVYGLSESGVVWQKVGMEKDWEILTEGLDESL